MGKIRRCVALFNKFRNEGKLTLQDLFSDEMLMNSLEKLPWEYGQDNKGHAFETVKLRTIQKESQVLGVIINLIRHRLRLGQFVYTRTGNLLEREGSSIKLKKPFNKIFSVSKVFTEVIKPIIKPKGYVKVD